MNKIFIGLVVLVAGALAGWYLLGSGGLKNKLIPYSTSNTPVATTTPSSGGSISGPQTPGGVGTSKGGVMERTVVTYSDGGFNPKTVTVKVGTTVTFMNDSSGAMWVASDPHPVHTLLSGFDELNSVRKGGSYEYTFTKVGTWTYHNHMNPSMKGTVVVVR